jgi:hypothetical protein
MTFEFGIRAVSLSTQTRQHTHTMNTMNTTTNTNTVKRAGWVGRLIRWQYDALHSHGPTHWAMARKARVMVGPKGKLP